MPTTIDNLLSRMTLEEKIGQMILASIEVSRMDAGTREFLRKNHIGNVILFGKNCAGRAALAQLNAEIQHTVMAENGLPALIAIDQEGGCVTRLRSEATVFPSAMVIARTGDPSNAYKVGRMMGGELRALGINLDCAPVLDTLSGPAERRYYGQTVQSIADYGCAMARGLRDAGVLACGKHFPGHEQTGADTHFGFVVDNTPRDTLMNSCLTPFCRAMSEDLASVMVSHVCFPALDDTDTPCSMSAPVIQGVLRGQLGYQGLVISDGLQMHAILDQYGAPQGCVQAALAGCDLLIIGNGGDNADPTGKDVQTPCIRALCDAVADGTLPMARVDESVRRILACKLALGWTMPARQPGLEQSCCPCGCVGRNRRDGTRPPRPAAAARRDVIYCAGVRYRYWRDGGRSHYGKLCSTGCTAFGRPVRCLPHGGRTAGAGGCLRRSARGGIRLWHP